MFYPNPANKHHPCDNADIQARFMQIVHGMGFDGGHLRMRGEKIAEVGRMSEETHFPMFFYGFFRKTTMDEENIKKRI